MPMQFKCGHCGQLLRIDERLAGSPVTCGSCGRVVTVPTPDRDPSPPAMRLRDPSNPLEIEPARHPMASHHPKKRGGVPKVVWELIGVLAFFVVLIIVKAVAWYASSWQTGPKLIATDGGHIKVERIAPHSLRDSNEVRRPPPPPQPPVVRRRHARATRFPAAAFQLPEIPEYSADSSPFTPLGKPAPAVAADRRADSSGGSLQVTAAAWVGDDVRIPFENEERVTLGPVGCPVVVVGNNVWHLKKKLVVQILQGDYPSGAPRVLAPSGRWFAASTESANKTNAPVTVWDLSTGQPCLTIPGQSERYIDLLALVRDHFLLLGSRNQDKLQVWDVASGTRCRSIIVAKRSAACDKTIFTPDGLHFVAPAGKRLIMVDTKANKEVAVLEMPPPPEIELGAGQPLSAHDIDQVHVSPDGQEFSGFRATGSRLLCWDPRGNLTVDAAIPAVTPWFWHVESFDWLPANRGWIVCGHVIERRSYRVVATVRGEAIPDLMVRAIDPDHLLGNFTHGSDVLRVVRIPWDQIHRSLAMLGNGTSAKLSPATPVSIYVSLVGPRTSQREITQLLTAAVAERLAHEGFQVQAGQTTVFSIAYSEHVGDPLSKLDRIGSNIFRNESLSRFAQSVTAKLELTVVSDKEVLWRDELTASTTIPNREAIHDMAVRKKLLDKLAREMSSLLLPYFIPESEDDVTLPMLIE